MSNFGNIEDSFKDAFSNWEPEHSAADMNKAWQNVSKHIPAPQAGHTVAQQAGKSLIKGGVSAGKIAAISSIAAVVVTSAILLYNTSTSSNQKDNASQKQVVKENTFTQSPENKAVTDQNVNSGNTTSSESNSVKTTVRTPRISGPSNIIASTLNSSTNPDVSKSNVQTASVPGSSGPIITTQKGQSPYNDNSSQTSLDRDLEDTSICESDDYILKDESSRKMIIDWGDGTNPVMTFNTIKHTYNKSGSYTLTVKSDGESINRQVHVKKTPVAHFSFYESDGMTAKFRNTSEGGSTFNWNFGDNNTEENRGNAEHTYSDTGNYKVKLIATISGCSSSIMHDIHLSNHIVRIPNIFTPNGDGVDELFDISVEGQITNFELTIHDFKNNIVFHSTDINNKWDGTHNGIPCQPGTYYYVVQWQYPDGTREPIEGFLQLNR